MKNFKFLFFVFILIISFDVLADTSYDMTSRITSPVNFSECGNGSYTGVELNGATNCWKTNTRYQGTLNRIYFNLPAPTGTTFEPDTAYRLTLKMATEDWRNNFGTVVVSPGSSYSNNFVDTFTFVSMKQVNITFTVPYGGSTTYQTLWVNLPANSSSHLITGTSNWNLSNVTLTKLTSGSGGGSTNPSGPSTTWDDTGIINNNNENTQDIINNNNTNTQDVINNNNENTDKIISSIEKKCSNLINSNSADRSSGVTNVTKTISSLSFKGLDSTTSSNYVGFTLNVLPNTTYYLSSTNPNRVIAFTTDYNIIADMYSPTSSMSFNTGNNSTIYLLFYSNGTSLTIYNNIMLSTDNLPFCVFGSSSNRLDETNTTINNSTNNIINNQNQNTQDIIDSNFDNNHTCRTIDMNTIDYDGRYLGTNGQIIRNDDFGIVQFIRIYEDSTIKVLNNRSGAASTCFYNSSKSLISCISSGSMTAGSTLTIPQSSYYVRFSINKNENKPTFSLCNKSSEELTHAIDETNDYLKDDTDPSISDSALNDVFGRVHFSDPLSYLLTLPTQLINKVVSMSDTCSPIDLGTLYGVHLTLPCINLENYLGSDLWSILDVILSVGLLSVILKNFYDTISNLLTLGGEKEAKEKFSMPTPMDFLAMILGGDNR